VANSASDKETCQSIIQHFGKVTKFFNWKAKGEVTYLNVQHIAMKTRVEVIYWVCKNFCPFNIIKDQGFNHLIKTGQPNYYISLLSTVGHDVKKIFARVQKGITKML
jgi:hypothetical protein